MPEVVETEKVAEVVQEEMSDYEYMMSCLYDNDWKRKQKMTNLQITLANLQSEYKRNFEINKSLRAQIRDLKFQVVKEKAFAKVLRQSAKMTKRAEIDAKRAMRIEALEKKIMALRMRWKPKGSDPRGASWKITGNYFEQTRSLLWKIL